jgi:REP element-mobilizing transposase RayT
MQQLTLDLPPTPRRKGTHGGKRRGAGRPAKDPRRPAERHAIRPRLTRHIPVHVTLRANPAIETLRCDKVFRAVRSAAFHALAKGKIRIVALSLQKTHMHAVIEADDRMHLARGLQGFQIALARRINRALGRRGNVFTDRYHARQIAVPYDLRNTLIYVLNNFRHHGSTKAAFDVFSSATTFGGWSNLESAEFFATIPSLTRYEVIPTAEPRSWLLRVGWRRHLDLGVAALLNELERDFSGGWHPR